MAFAMKNGEKVLFTGDSITDCGRRTEPSMLGSGYVKLFRELAIANLPGVSLEIINKGIGGNTVVDLENRWTDEMICHKPDWMSILIGINDVHRVVKKTEGWEELLPDKYYARYGKLLKRTAEETGCKIILIEPFFISRDKTDSYRGSILKNIGPYREAVSSLSKEYGTLLLKMHDIFQKHLGYREMETFCGEPVHPNHAGHMIIAQELFNLLKK